MNEMRRMSCCMVGAVGAISLLLASGCSTKNYVRSQTAPLIQKTNELDDATATNNRTIKSVDEHAQAGIQQAQASANQAGQNATAATQAATQAQSSAREAVTRADTLASVIAGLDNYKQVGDVSVNFAFNKSILTKAAKAQLDDFGGTLATAKSYILEVTGGTDSVGGSDYNYALSQRRADAVVQYLASKYSVAPHKFYLIGVGKDQAVDSNKTAAGRAKNRRVEIQVLSNAPGVQGSAVSSVRQ